MRYLLWGDTLTCFRFDNANEGKKITDKLMSRRPETKQAFTHPTIEVPKLKSADFIPVDGPKECVNHIWDEREEFPRCKKCKCFYPGFGGR